MRELNEQERKAILERDKSTDDATLRTQVSVKVSAAINVDIPGHENLFKVELAEL